MTLSELYETVGGDLRNVLERLGDVETVKHFLLIFSDDPSYSLLMRNLQEASLECAFRAAHTLKGISLSLGFERLGGYSGALCEELQEGIPPSGILLQQLKTEYPGFVLILLLCAGLDGCEAGGTDRLRTLHYHPSGLSRNRCRSGFCCTFGWLG